MLWNSFADFDSYGSDCGKMLDIEPPIHVHMLRQNYPKKSIETFSKTFTSFIGSYITVYVYKLGGAVHTQFVLMLIAIFITLSHDKIRLLKLVNQVILFWFSATEWYILVQLCCCMNFSRASHVTKKKKICGVMQGPIHLCYVEADIFLWQLTHESTSK